MPGRDGRDDGMLSANLHNDRKKHERELAIERNLQQWLAGATRFLVLANAGAAAATLAFIGAVVGTALGKPDVEVNVPIVALVALTFFILGVTMAGLVILGQLQKAWKEWIASEFGPVEWKHVNVPGKITTNILEKLSYYHSPPTFLQPSGFFRRLRIRCCGTALDCRRSGGGAGEGGVLRLHQPSIATTVAAPVKSTSGCGFSDISPTQYCRARS